MYVEDCQLCEFVDRVLGVRLPPRQYQMAVATLQHLLLVWIEENTMAAEFRKSLYLDFRQQKQPCQDCFHVFLKIFLLCLQG